jgi:hypothetical protein
LLPERDKVKKERWLKMNRNELFSRHILERFKEKAVEEAIEAERKEYEHEFEFEEVSGCQ